MQHVTAVDHSCRSHHKGLSRMASRQRTCTYKAQRGGCKTTNAFLSKCCVAVCHTPEHLGSPAQRVGDKVLHAHKRSIGGLSVGASGILQEVRDGDKVRVVVEQDAACWIAVTPRTPCVLVVPERVQGGQRGQRESVYRLSKGVLRSTRHTYSSTVLGTP